MNAKMWIVLAGILGALGVSLGAYHAHGLEKLLSGQGLNQADIDRRMDVCEVGVRYQMYHALALLGLGVLSAGQPSRCLNITGTLLLMGVVLFTGPLYATALLNLSVHWAIVPTGGMLMILGWASLAIAGLGATEK